MGDLADYGKNYSLDQLFGSGNPSTFYIAAFTTMPAEDGTGGVEPSDDAYARAVVANNASNFPAAASGTKSNAADILWPEATEVWGDIVGIGLYDLASGGNLHALKTAPSPVNIIAGSRLHIAIGGLDITAD